VQLAGQRMVKDALAGNAKTVGSSAAIASVIQATMLVPVNSIQTRMQASGLGFSATLRQVFEAGALSGFKQLYLALPPTMAMLGLRQGVIFGSGSWLKKQLPPQWPEVARDAASMGISAFFITGVLFPMDTYKTRLQLGLPGKSPHQFYQGFLPAVSHAVVGRSIWMVTRNGLERNVPDPPSAVLRYWKHLICGGMAGVIVTCVVFPLDTLKKRMQASDGKHLQLRHETRALLAQGGLLRFYRGIQVKLVMNFAQGGLFNSMFVLFNRFLGH